MTFNLISRSSFGTLCWQECKGESLEVEIERQTVKGGRPPSTQQWPGARNCVHHVRKWRRFEEDLIGGCRRGRRGHHGAARRGGGGSILARHRTSEGVDGANRYCATPILVPNRNRNLRHGSEAVSQLCNSWIIYSVYFSSSSTAPRTRSPSSSSRPVSVYSPSSALPIIDPKGRLNTPFQTCVSLPVAWSSARPSAVTVSSSANLYIFPLA